mgnify:FL=1
MGQGGYGQQIFQGFAANSHTQLMTYLVLTVPLALVADAVLLVVQRLITPWRRGVAT